MKWVAFGLFFCSTLLWAASRSKTPDTLIITNVNVIDTRYGAIQPNSTVIIRDGMIAAVMKIAILDTGAHSQVINAEGRYLIPGLWDMNTHLTRAQGWDRTALLNLYVAAGVTGIRDLDSAQQTTRGRLEPEIVLAGGDSASKARLFERHWVAGLREILEACAVNGEKVSEVAEHPDSLEQAWIVEEPTATCDRKKAWELFLKMSDHATWMVPSLVSLAEEPAPRESSGEVVLTPATATEGESRPPKFEKNAETVRGFNLVAGMRRAGVQFLAGSNGPHSDESPGLELHRELELLVASGFTPFQALQTATFNPALSMANLDKHGVVEPGHVADLVLLDANPLREIGNTQKIAGVVVRGTYLSRGALDAMLVKAQQSPLSPASTASATELKNKP